MRKNVLLSIARAACATLICGCASAPAFAEDTEKQSAPPPPAAQEVAGPPAPAVEADSERLAKQLSNPVASLISVPLQNNYDWGLGPDNDGGQFKLNIQPVVPISLNKEWNLISRTILPLIAQDDVLPQTPAIDGSQFGFGDTVQSLFLSPEKPTKGGIVWGAGPVFLIPTGTDDALSSRKWGAGPTIVVLKQSGPWTIGTLANHIWSVAGNKDRDDVSTTYIQPFLSHTSRKATTLGLNAESTYDWVHKQWTVPVNLTIAQLFPPKMTRMKFPFQVQFGVRHYFARPEGGPRNGLRLALVALFPRK